MEATAAQW